MLDTILLGIACGTIGWVVGVAHGWTSGYGYGWDACKEASLKIVQEATKEYEAQNQIATDQFISKDKLETYIRTVN